MLTANTPLVQKDPTSPLRVIMIGRISTPQQNESNIVASFAADEKFLSQFYDGPVTVKHLGERGSGLRTDRQSIIEAEEEIATGTWDLVLMEDLSRAYRNPRHQYEFIQDAVDNETRVICIGDNLDTADPNWEVMMGAASLRHGLHIPDTRRRVRRTAEYTFHKGGMVQKIRFGYRKLTKEEAASGQFGPVGLRLAKLAEATPIVMEMRRRVMAGYEYEAIAVWLNESEIPPGSYSSKRKWTGALVSRFLRSCILQGVRRFRETIFTTQFKDGKHRRKKNASPETKYYPELAHMTKEEQEELWIAMDSRTVNSGQKSGRGNPRHGIARDRGIWPSKQVRCAICKGFLERTLNDQLKCKHAFDSDNPCWNHVQVKAETIRQKILPQLLEQLDRHPAFRATLIEAAWASYAQQRQRQLRKSSDLDAQIQQLSKERQNLVQAIRCGGEIEALVEELKAVEGRLRVIDLTRQATEDEASTLGIQSREQFAARLNEGLLVTARENFEFTDLMRDYVTEFVIQPVQAMDSTQVFPRAKLTFRLSAITGSESSPVEIRIVADCFQPSGPVEILEQCRQAKAEHPKWGCVRIARLIKKPHMTVKRSLHYLELMASANTNDPFRELSEKPEKAARWTKRRKNNLE